MNCTSINWRRHALERMFQRNISRDDVKKAMKNGKVIEVYNDDQPFPSQLIFAIINEKALHVVVAEDEYTRECFVVTAYTPSKEYFEDDFITRKIL